MNLIQSILINSKLLRLLTFGALLFLFLVLLQKIYNAVCIILHYRSFPSQKGNFFLGNLKQMIPTFPSFSSKVSSTKMADLIVNTQDNEGVFLFWLTWIPVVVVSDYRAAEAIFTKPNHNKGSSYKFLGLKDGLVVSHGAKWKARRRMIEPFFTTKNLASYVPVMKQSFALMIKKMEEEKVQFVDMSENIHRSSLDIIVKSTVSVPIESMRQFKDKLLSDLDFCEKMVFIRMINPLMWLDNLFYQSGTGKMFKAAEDRIDHFMESSIKERLLSRTEFPKVNESEKEMRNDFIDMLMKHYNPNTTDVTKSIDIEGMKEEILNLIIAGHDTIAAGLRWTLFLLGCHLDCQEHLYDEITSSLDVNDDDNVHLEAINRLTYLDQCIKESMRLYPPIPILSRVTDHDAQVGDYRILKGTQICFSYYSIHRDRKVWENPDSFDPDRFSEERYAKIPKYAFIPFGYGQRSCIGQRFAMIEMKLFLIQLLRKYKIISTQKVEEIELIMDVTTKPRIPLTLKLESRNKEAL